MKIQSKTTKRIAIFVIFALTLGLATMSNDSISAQTAQTPGKSTLSPKIDSALAEVLQLSGGGASAQSVQSSAATNGVQVTGNSVKVVIETTSPASFLVALVAALSGGSVVGQSRNFIELLVPLNNDPLNAMLQVANITGIAYIRSPLTPQALVTSEGVGVTGASTFQGNGFNGAGVKIAVIDLGFAGLSLAQSQGELPFNAFRFDFSGTGLEASTSHGTAVAEIVHDMAPNAELYLMKIADEVDLENAVDEAIRQGVDVINHSVGWFNTSFYDGTGPIVLNVQRARSAGILWVNAAGNYGQRHWGGIAQDSNQNGWAEFQGQEGLRFTAQAGQAVNVFLTWRDWPVSSQDYDLFITNTSGAILASSERLQSGTQPPTESLFYTAPFSGTFEIRVKPLTVSSPKELSIFNLNQDMTPVTTSGSIISPADSSSALSVGAVNHTNWTTGPIQVFSSQGPTGGGLSKPDMVGPDSVSVSTSQFNPFAGTSAAAPHVAGAAALLLSENPTLNVTSLEAKLKGDAIPMGSPNQFGSGRLNLVGQPTGRPDLTIFSPTFFPANPNIGDNVTIQAQITNQGAVASGSFFVQLTDSFGNTQQTLTSLGPSGSTTVTFNRQLFAQSQQVTLTVDPFNQIDEVDEGNNSTQITISSSPVQQPDLVVSSITATPNSPQVGSLVSYDITVHNQGSASAGFFFVELTDAQGQDRRSVNGLAAGATARVTIQRTLSVSPDTIFGTVDVFNQVTESNENNNVNSITITGNTPTPQGIDVRTDRTNYQLNELIDVDFTLDADGFVRIYVVNAAGTVSTLFPQGGSGFLSAGVYDVGQLINSSLQVVAPAGVKHIHAVSTDTQVSFGVGNVTNTSWINPTTFQSHLQSRILATSSSIDFDLDFETISVGSLAPPTIDVNTDRTSYNVGEPIQVTFTTNTEGYIRIYRVNAAGTVETLYPQGGSGFLGAGAYNLATLIGASVIASAPGGSEHIHGVITEEQVSFLVGNQTNGTWTNPTTFHSHLTQRINATNPSMGSDFDFQSITVNAGGGNQPPVASFTFNPTNPVVNQQVALNASGSFDPDGFITSYQWTVTGSSSISGSGVTFNPILAAIRDFTVTLTVTDNLGATSSTTQIITVTGPPAQPLSIDVSTNQTSYTIGLNAQVNFNLSEDGFVRIYDVDPNGTVSTLYPQGGSGFLSAGTYSVSQLIGANLTVVGPAGTETIHAVVTEQQVAFAVGNQTNASWINPAAFQARLLQSINVVNPSMDSAFDFQSFTVTASPTPSPQTPPGLGFYIESRGSGQMIITVQGDENWTQDHFFTIRLRMSDTNNNVFGFTSLNVQEVGNAADDSPAFDSRNLVLHGDVQDGQVIYTIGIRNPAAVWFDTEFNLAFNDGKVESGAHEIPIYAVIGNQDIRIEPRAQVTGEFSLLGNNGRLLPLVQSNTSICSSAARQCTTL